MRCWYSSRQQFVAARRWTAIAAAALVRRVQLEGVLFTVSSLPPAAYRRLQAAQGDYTSSLPCRQDGKERKGKEEYLYRVNVIFRPQKSYFFNFSPTKDLAPFSIHTPQKTLF